MKIVINLIIHWITQQFRFESYSSGILTLSLVYKVEDRITNKKIKINFNGLTNFSSTNEYFILKFRAGNIEEYDPIEGTTHENMLIVYAKAESNTSWSIINWGSEPDLYNRFIKALNVLITYNNPKQKF